MKGKIFTDTSGIINWIPENETGDVEGTKMAMDIMQSLAEEQGQSKILVDLTKGQRPNDAQRQIIINTIKANYHKIKKLAIFGENALMKVVAFYIINTSGYSNMQFFMNRNQATQWLQQEK